MTSTPTAPTGTTSPAAKVSDHQDTFLVRFPPDVTFTITADMLKHDAPSMFSSVFLSNSQFQETSSREITIPNKSPELFTLILDYLRGYTIFPLNESAIPPRWLPLQKTYDNLRRDASYYGLLRLEVECTSWLKRQIDPLDRQAVLKLDFTPFATCSTSTSHPLTVEMMLECHLADVSLLRKRFLKFGAKTLTYGPMPWKQIFEQIKNPSDRDGVLQCDGSAIIEVAPVFLKPPRTAPDDPATIIDERKTELAKIHVSKQVTRFILDGIRPAGMNNFITLRFHGTDITTSLTFHNEAGQFIFSDKLQSDGYATLRSLAAAEEPVLQGKESIIPLDRNDGTVVEVDSDIIEWGNLYEWSQFRRNPRDPVNEIRRARENLCVKLSLCDKYFGSSETREPTVSAPFKLLSDGRRRFTGPQYLSLQKSEVNSILLHN